MLSPGLSLTSARPARLLPCPSMGYITWDEVLASGFPLLGDGTVITVCACALFWDVIGSFQALPFRFCWSGLTRKHLPGSTLARACVSDGMVPSVLLVALLQPQWLLHMLALTVLEKTHGPSVCRCAAIATCPPSSCTSCSTQTCCQSYALSAPWSAFLLGGWGYHGAHLCPASYCLVSTDL